MIPFLSNVLNRQIHRNRKQIGEIGEEKKQWPMGTGFLSGAMKSRINHGDACTTLWTYYNWIKRINYMICELYFKKNYGLQKWVNWGRNRWQHIKKRNIPITSLLPSPCPQATTDPSMVCIFRNFYFLELYIKGIIFVLFGFFYSS